MCGIVCGNFYISEECVKNTIHSLRTRGPDFQNVCFLEDGTFMAHALLSVFTKSQNIQPIWSNDKKSLICVNGEVYNYYELKNLLESKGYIFETNSDSEIFIHGLHWIGIDFLNRINGEFCFVMYNIESKTWTCGTDSFGTKPLRYYHKENRFAIASEIKALKSLGVPIELNRDSCLFSLSTQTISKGKTLFSDVYAVPPSCVLIVSESNSYLKNYGETKNVEVDHYDIEHIEFLLEQAIVDKATMQYGDKVAVCLSGGIDSSCLPIYLKKNHINFSCYSVNFPDSIYSEKNDIDDLCDNENIVTKYVDITESDLIEYFPTVVLNSESLCINPHAVGKYLLNRQIYCDNIRICLTGDGADEIFYGYSHFHTDNKYQFVINSSNTNRQFLPLLNENLNFDALLQETTASAQQLYIQYWLYNYGLMILGDLQSSVLSQEHRYPYLDKRLVNYVNSIRNFKEMNYPSKKVLRDIISKRNLSLSLRSKRPFTSPVITKRWLPLFDEYIFENKKFWDLSIFNKSQLIEYIYKLNSNLMPNRILLTQVLSLGILSKEM